jgi:hypothetical protein
MAYRKESVQNTTAAATLASSIYSSATKAIAEEFGVGDVVSTLSLSLFLLGCDIEIAQIR